MLLNMGPQHPSTHGVLRFILKTDGEIIKSLDPDVGFLHRSIERIGEMVTFEQFMPYTDRVDYLSAMNANHAWARAVETACGIEVPRRAAVIRTITDELNRIISHLLAVGALGMDLGAATPFLHAIREREKVNDIIEALCGARLTYNYVRIGGVWYDLPHDFVDKCTEFLDKFEPALEEFDRLLGQGIIFRQRTANVAPMNAEDAIAHGLVGPNLRAAGVKYDLRRDEPYGIYPELDFEVPIGTGIVGTVGDCFDRYWVRICEMRESVKILRQCFKMLPEDKQIRAKLPKILKAPAGEVYVPVESSRGEMGYYLVTDGGPKAYRVRIRTGSFAAMKAIETLASGLMIADLVAVIAALDVVAPEIDR
ncbi:MAG: NADH-quinone oxidoreductase subunit D [Chrysiogenetes bacterium]|nr:NADH-quinone oxidoreductase subunit D [Chrysiogenetes bacterium]